MLKLFKKKEASEEESKTPRFIDVNSNSLWRYMVFYTVQHRRKVSKRIKEKKVYSYYALTYKDRDRFIDDIKSEFGDDLKEINFIDYDTGNQYRLREKWIDCNKKM